MFSGSNYLDRTESGRSVKASVYLRKYHRRYFIIYFTLNNHLCRAATKITKTGYIIMNSAYIYKPNKKNSMNCIFM